jgi:hypothetical protein
MDTLNKGINYSVLDKIARCQHGLNKGQRGVLPSSHPLKQMGKSLEEACVKFLDPTISEDGLSWVCDPKEAITSFLVHFRCHVIGTNQRPTLVALHRGWVGDLRRQSELLLCWIEACGPQAPFPATSQEAPLASEQN